MDKNLKWISHKFWVSFLSPQIPSIHLRGFDGSLLTGEVQRFGWASLPQVLGLSISYVGNTPRKTTKLLSERQGRKESVLEWINLLLINLHMALNDWLKRWMISLQTKSMVPKVVPKKYKHHSCGGSSTPSSCSSGSGKSFSYEAFLEEYINHQPWSLTISWLQVLEFLQFCSAFAKRNCPEHHLLEYLELILNRPS